MATIDEHSTRLAQELDAAVTLNEPWEPVIERHLREVAREAIDGLHRRQVRCLRQCVPNNAPLNTVLKYLDDAKRDTRAAVINGELK